MNHDRVAAIPALFLLALTVSCAAGHEPVWDEVGHYDTAGWAHDVAPDADLLYVSDRQGGFLIFDRGRGWLAPTIHAPVKDVISLAPNSGRPLLAARFEGLVLASESGRVVARHANGDIANAAAISGGLGYGAYGSHGLVIVRMGAASLSLLAELPTPGWSHDIKLWDDRALLADWNYGMRVVDVRVPERPVEIGVLPSPSTAICIALGKSGGKTAAAVAEGHGGVSIVSFDAAGRPSLVARHSLGLHPGDPSHPETGGWAHGAAWCGDYLFVANWKRGLAVLDVGTPSRPRLIRELPTRGTSLGVKAEASPDGTILIYLADGEDGLRVFRIGDRRKQPEQVPAAEAVSKPDDGAGLQPLYLLFSLTSSWGILI